MRAKRGTHKKSAVSCDRGASV